MKHLELKGRANVRTAGMIWSLYETYKERTIPIILLACNGFKRSISSNAQGQGWRISTWNCKNPFISSLNSFCSMSTSMMCFRKLFYSSLFSCFTCLHYKLFLKRTAVNCVMFDLSIPLVAPVCLQAYQSLSWICFPDGYGIGLN